MTSGKIMNRKTTRFLPFCPVYGIGTTVFYFTLTPFYDYPIAVAILGIIVGTTIEYIFGKTILDLFHVYVWDYKSLKSNYNRLIAPYFSLIWCVLSLIFIYAVSPFITPIIYRFSDSASYILLAVMTVDALFSIDMLIAIGNGENSDKYMCPVLKRA